VASKKETDLGLNQEEEKEVKKQQSKINKKKK